MVEKWSEEASYVLKSLERIEKAQEKMCADLYAKMNAVAIQIAVINTKSAQSGAITGTICGAVVSIVVGFVLHTVTK